MASYDKVEIANKCGGVRDDNSETNWVAYVYEGKDIVFGAEGHCYDELKKFVTENNDRVYCYVRVETGDELSIRKKFAFVTYYGSAVSPIAKAKCSTDKQAIKAAFGDFAGEFLYDKQDIDMDEIIKDLRKAGGANYDGQNAQKA